MSGVVGGLKAKINLLYGKRPVPKNNWECHQDAGYHEAISEVLVVVDEWQKDNVSIPKKQLQGLWKDRPRFVLFSKETELHSKRGVIEKYEDFLVQVEKVFGVVGHPQKQEETTP